MELGSFNHLVEVRTKVFFSMNLMKTVTCNFEVVTETYSVSGAGLSIFCDVTSRLI